MDDFEKIYSEYYDLVFGYICSLSHDEHWAEEITQDAFLKALRHINTFRGECKLNVWLCQIARNTFYTAAKQHKRQADCPPEQFPSGEAVDQKIADRETARQIHRLLHGLEEPYKEVFWMRTFGELSFKEIAALFEKTESWARVTYHRAKIKLQEGVK